MLPLLLILVALISPVPAQSQETAPEIQEEAQPESLFQRTLAQDIRSAEFRELVDWLETLGLSTRGSRRELENRLFAYHELSPPPLPPERSGRTITIESTRLGEYFEIEEVDENYVILRGGVSIRLEDDDVIHYIEAEEVLFNQARNRMTARGGVVYRIERERGDETFRGRALSFDISNWEGVFLDGASTRPRVIEGEELEFTFEGDTIIRSGEDIILLEHGTITSSPVDPPNWRLRARRIWVFGPGEWALQNAVLYVGRVPVLYFPFFFVPGDELFFHPSIGYRTRAGAFLQTTTYLVGRRAEEAAPFSFLQLTEEQQTRRERERWFVFLRDTDRPDTTSPDRTVKALADIYTRLGVLIGVHAQLPRFGPLNSVNWRSSLGVSRHLYPIENIEEFVSPYRVVDGRAQTDWNRSNFAGWGELPFRYEVQSNASTALLGLSMQLELLLMSDPFFRRDFDNRAESIDFAGLLGFSEIIDAQPDTVNTLRWSLRGAYRPELPSAVKPYLSNLSISSYSWILYWESRDTPTELLRPEAQTAVDSPERRFFYPNRYTTPDLTGRVEGTLLDSARRRPGIDSPEELPEGFEPAPLRPPWGITDDNDRTAAAEDPDDRLLRLPSLRPSFTVPEIQAPFGYRVSYSVVPRLTVDNFTQNTEWRLPEDIDWQTRYAQLNSDNTGRLSYRANLYRRLFVLENSLILRQRYRSVYNLNENLSDTTRRSLENQAFRFTGVTGEHQARLSSFPLQDHEILDQSSVVYRLNTLLYRRVFDSRRNDDPDGPPVYVDEYFEWDPEFVSNHDVSANLRARLWRATQSLSLTATLPPVEEEFTGRAEAITGPLRTTVSTGVRRPEGEDWIWNPLVIDQRLQPSPNITLTERLVYSIEDDEITSSITNLRLWFLTLGLTARTTNSFRFVGAPNGWEERDDRDFRPTNARVSVEYDTETPPLWKNRVRSAALLRSTLDMDLLRYTESVFDIRFEYLARVHQFMDLRFASVTRNDQPYRYVPQLSDELGLERRNVFQDLLDSFNFFDTQARETSFFNVQQLEVGVVHYLDDWTLSIEYAGRPELETTPEGTQQFKWSSRLELALVWRPIPELRREILFEDGELVFEE